MDWRNRNVGIPPWVGGEEPYLEFLRFSKSVEDKNCNNRRDEEQNSDQNGRHQLQLKLGAETEFETLKIYLELDSSVTSDHDIGSESK